MNIFFKITSYLIGINLFIFDVLKIFMFESGEAIEFYVRVKIYETFSYMYYFKLRKSNKSLLKKIYQSINKIETEVIHGIP